jgi:type II secretory pathway component PulF
MPIYKWEGKTTKGVIKKGEMEAQQQGIAPLQVQVIKEEEDAFYATLEQGMKWDLSPSDFRHGLRGEY